MSSDWQFASKEGTLRWTSPALPDRGQDLFSVLSPNLLLGYNQQGDVLPVDYVKLGTILRVGRSGATGIEIERDGGLTLLLVAETTTLANDWLAVLQKAMDGKGDEGGVPPPRRQPRSIQPAVQQQEELSPQPKPVAPLPPPEQLAPAQVPVQAPFQSTEPMREQQQQEPAPHQPQPQYAQPAALPNLSSAPQAAACPTGEAHQYRPLSDIVGGARIGGAAGNPNPPPTAAPEPRGNSRPLPGAGAAPWQSTSPSLSGVFPESGLDRLRSSRPMDVPQQQTSMGMPTDATNLNSSAVGGRRPRSGMMVQLPASQTVNRNIAPNLSAMWKEWQGPDQTTYLLFEPTGTMLRRPPGGQEFEMYVQGSEELTDEELAAHPYAHGATTVNLNAQSVRNLQNYGTDEGIPTDRHQMRDITAASVLRTEVVKTPRGQYSPSRHAPVEALASPRVDQHGYSGRRVHRVTLGVNREEPGRSVIQHEVETLGSSGLVWDPRSNQTAYADGSRSLTSSGPKIGSGTLHRQWEEVRQTLMKGRFFKKHALRTHTSQYRMVFLTSDNAYICAVPTSAVMQNASKDPRTFGNVTDTVQYYGPDTRAIPLNTIQHVSLGTEEDFVHRRKDINPEATFCIVSKTHAFVLECRNREEAEFYADAWTFFLYHSKPLAKKRTPQMVAPVTYGTRTGVRF